jgi:hypothetical protein
MFLAMPAHGQQCGAHWAAGAIPGLNGIVKAVTVWDRDGPVPLAPVVVAGGDVAVTIAGSSSVASIALFDGTDWRPLGSGVDRAPFNGGDRVLTLLGMPNGDLIVGGNIEQAGGVAVGAQRTAAMLPHRLQRRWLPQSPMTSRTSSPASSSTCSSPVSAPKPTSTPMPS